MADDINIHVKVPDAQQAKQHLDDITSRARNVGSGVKEGSQKGAEGMDKLSRSAESAQSGLGKVKSSLTG